MQDHGVVITGQQYVSIGGRRSPDLNRQIPEAYDRTACIHIRRRWFHPQFNSSAAGISKRGAADPAAIERIFAANGWPPHGVTACIHFITFIVRRTRSLVLPAVRRPCCSAALAGQCCRFGRRCRCSAGGVAHCNQGQSSDLLIVGAYPENRPGPDLRRGKPEEHDAAKRAVEGVPLPAQDPIGSIDRALSQLWARSA